MLQGRIWGRGTGKAGEWEALTQGTHGERHDNMSLHTCCEFPPLFAPRVAEQNIDYIKMKRCQCPGWILVQNCVALHAAISACAISAPYKIPMLHTRVAEWIIMP